VGASHDAHTHFIILTPTTWERLKEKLRERPSRKTNARQVTVEGKEFDLRNAVNFALIRGRIEDVENVAQSHLHQLRQHTTKRQRRRLLLELHRVMLLRGEELSRPLYGSMCLRLGMPLPADFWHLPPESKRDEDALAVLIDHEVKEVALNEEQISLSNLRMVFRAFKLDTDRALVNLGTITERWSP